MNVKKSLKQLLEEENVYKKKLIEMYNTYEAKKEIILKPLNTVHGKRLDGTDIIEIRNEHELCLTQIILEVFFLYYEFVYDEVDKNTTQNREQTRYEALKKEYLKMATLMKLRRDECFSDFELKILDVPYEAYKSKTQGYKNIRKLIVESYMVIGVGISRANEIANTIVNFMKYDETIQINSFLSVLFNDEISEPMENLVYKKLETIETFMKTKLYDNINEISSIRRKKS